MELNNKKIFITGAGVRIGRALALALAQQGAIITVHYHKTRPEVVKNLLKNLSDISGKGGHNAVQADFSRHPERLESLIDRPYDVLINNASVFHQSPLASETFENARSQFDINYWAPYVLINSFRYRLNSDKAHRPTRSGVIINILDQRITKIDANGASYSLSKKALADLTMTAAAQFAPNIRVNAIAPGPVFPPTGIKSKKMKLELTSVPLRKKVELNDLISSCLFLIANDSITGQIIFVDGGQHLNVFPKL